MIVLLQLANEFHKVAHVPRLDWNTLRDGSSASARMAECHMARARMAIHLNTESPRYDFEILDAPISRVLPHTGEDLFGI
jgi:hypothetical protein